jgi:hypothetical protein
MNSFMGELRRGNVFRVGADCAVAAWLVLQVAELVARKEGLVLVAS